MMKQKFQGRHGIISWNLENCEVNHGIIKESHRNLIVQKDLGLQDSDTLNKRTFCVTVAIDHWTVDGFHDEVQLSAKNTKRTALRRIS